MSRRVAEIPGFDSYRVTSDGMVLSEAKGWMPLVPGRNGNGYPSVGLYSRQALKHKVIHRLVAKAFVPNPEGKPQVNHINGNKNDNRASNLEWMTAKENVAHSKDVLGRGGRAKVPTAMIGKDGSAFIFPSYSDAERAMGFHVENIRRWVLGRSKPRNKYQWRAV